MIDMVNLAADNQNGIIGKFKLSINQSPTQLKTPDLFQTIYTLFPLNLKKQQRLVHMVFLNSESLLSELAQYPWITMGNNCPFDEALNNKLKQLTKANVQTSHDYS